MANRNTFETLLDRRKRGANAESTLQRAIVQTLRMHGLLVIRVPGQGVLRNGGTPAAFMTRSEMAGFPDLLVLGRRGLTAWLEVKTETGRLSPLQRQTIETLSRLGHIAAVVRSPESALAVLREHGFLAAPENTHESTLLRRDPERVPGRRRRARAGDLP
jgi:hypothetical protein